MQLLRVVGENSVTLHSHKNYETRLPIVGYEPKQSLREKRLLKQYPWGTIATNGTLFSKGHSFFLHNHVYGKKSAPEQKGTIFQNSAPRGTVLQKKCWKRYPFWEKGTILVPLGALFLHKKSQKPYPFEKRGSLWKTVPLTLKCPLRKSQGC